MRSTVALSAVSELLNSVRVLLRPSSTSSTCSTVLSAFSAALVMVLMRLRSGPLRTVLSAMSAIMALAGLLEKTARGLLVE